MIFSAAQAQTSLRYGRSEAQVKLTGTIIDNDLGRLALLEYSDGRTKTYTLGSEVYTGTYIKRISSNSIELVSANTSRVIHFGGVVQEGIRSGTGREREPLARKAALSLFESAFLERERFEPLSGNLVGIELREGDLIELARFGLRRGDIVAKINGFPVHKLSRGFLLNNLDRDRDRIDLQVYRKGGFQNIPVFLRS